MPSAAEERLRFPIGPFRRGAVAPAERPALVARIAAHPAGLRSAVEVLDEESLARPLRPGAWTLRQLAHHVADAHLNGFVRFRLALTEDEPTIRPYDQEGWAALADAARGPLEPSLLLLEGVVARWVRTLEGMEEAQWGRRFLHPEDGSVWTLAEAAALYAWHGDHHLAQLAGAPGAGT